MYILENAYNLQQIKISHVNIPKGTDNMIHKRDLPETNLQSKRISSRKYKFSDKVITERSLSKYSKM